MREATEYVTTIAIPVLRSLDNYIAQFLAGGYKLAIPFLNEMFNAKLNENVNFENIVKNWDGIFDCIVSFFDELNFQRFIHSVHKESTPNYQYLQGQQEI